jgi:hypothetical protein
MTHADFMAGYASGAIRVQVDRERAARLVAGRLMLPFVLLPVLGAGVALALTGRLVLGALVFLAALVFRYAVRASSPGFVLSRALGSAAFYEEALAAGLLKVERGSSGGGAR